MGGRFPAWCLASLTLAAGLCGCAKSQSSSDSGRVVVYSSVDEVFAAPICKRFEQETGIKVDLVPDTEETKSTGLLNRLIAEKQRPRADVFWSGDPVRAAILRRLLVCGVLCLAIAPALPLVVSSFGQETTRPFWTKAFADSVATTLLLGVGVSILSLGVGLPLGLLGALYRFPGRASLVLFLALPLLLPSFLPCIGWSRQFRQW